MSSSGTARAETLSLTVEDFINATKDYYKSNDTESIIEELSKKKKCYSDILSQKN